MLARGVFEADYLVDNKRVFLAIDHTGNCVAVEYIDPELEPDVDPDIIIAWLEGRLEALDPRPRLCLVEN
jgi:ABC-type Fe3+-hydroxamate transport system substrate-binding protein